MQLQSLEQLYEGEGYRRGQSTFGSTQTLIQPWIEKVSPFADEYRINVQQPREVAVSEVNTEHEQEHKVYSRVLLEAILKPEFQLVVDETHHKKVFGLLYSLDINNPICKTYSGYEYQACLNLQVFNPQAITTKQFTDPDFSAIYNAPDEFVNRIDAEKEEFERAFTFLHSTSFSGPELNEVLGMLARKCVKSAGLTSPYTNMVKMLQSKSDVQGGKIQNIYYKDDLNYTPWTIYQALTATLCNRPDYSTRPDRVLKVYNLFSEMDINFN